MRKILYIVLDGLGDLPSPELGGKTTLEAASTPNMDGLAKQGITGLMYTVGKGIAPESDIAVISILGYNAEKYYTGRGPLECYAAGLEVNDGDLAYRVNFATLGKDREIIDRRVGRDLTTEEATELAYAINSQITLPVHPSTFEFKNTIGYRGVLVIRSIESRLSANVTNTDPAYDKHGYFGVAKTEYENVVQKCKPTEGFENSVEARDAATLTNEFIDNSHRILEDDPVNIKRAKEGKLKANAILTRDGGDSLPKFPSFRDSYNLNFGCFVEMPVEEGIAMLTGLKVVELPLPTGKPKEDYPLRANKAIEALKDFDGLYIHIKGPDEPAHDGKAELKKESIASIDEYFFSNLLPRINLDQTIVTVTSDHSTPCITKAHSDDPVPLLIAGGSIKADSTPTFSEKACSKGSIGTIVGPKLMPKLVKLAKK